MTNSIKVTSIWLEVERVQLTREGDNNEKILEIQPKGEGLGGDPTWISVTLKQKKRLYRDVQDGLDKKRPVRARIAPTKDGTLTCQAISIQSTTQSRT